MPVIQTEGLTKFYGKARGILDLDLSVEPGEIFGFIGPNGAGKSTTIRLLLGLVQPTSGRAQVAGMDIVRENRQILSRVGYMPSEAVFNSQMRVKDVLRLSWKLRGVDCSTQAKELCRRLDLDGNRRISELSLGNRKKVAIVCAFQHRPELYVLDEPTSGLDPLIQKEFFSLIRERQQEGATIFLSSHVLSEIQQNCTRAAVVKEGRLVAVEPVSRLLKTNSRLVTLQGPCTLPEIPEITSVQHSGDTVRFLYQGQARSLLQLLGQMPVEDVTITEPDLEDVFLHYYEKGGESQ